jgi:hypothetical protein
MVSFRPHTMIWRTPDGEASESPEGYPIAGTPGEERQTPCRYHDVNGNGKVYQNEDSTQRVQVGKIRCDIGEMPIDGQMIEVIDNASGAQMFKGTVKEIYQAQLTYRINV